MVLSAITPMLPDLTALELRRNLDYLAEQGTISPGDQDIIDYADTADEAWGIIAKFYEL